MTLGENKAQNEVLCNAGENFIVILIASTFYTQGLLDQSVWIIIIITALLIWVSRIDGPETFRSWEASDYSDMDICIFPAFTIMSTDAVIKLNTVMMVEL